MKLLEQEFNGAYQVIIDHLKEYAERKGNEEFKKKLENSEQTANGLTSYICKEAKKQAHNGVAMISDQEVIGWAIHFVDENIMEEKATTAKVEYKETPRETADRIKNTIAERKAKEPKEPKESAKIENKPEQLSIFDLL